MQLADFDYELPPELIVHEAVRSYLRGRQIAGRTAGGLLIRCSNQRA